MVTYPAKQSVEAFSRGFRLSMSNIKYMNIVPTVGRMVYYKARGSADGVFPKVDRAAVITDVRENIKTDLPPGQVFQLRLCVMNPEGLFFTDWLHQGQEGGQWDWMPYQKDQQARLKD